MTPRELLRAVRQRAWLLFLAGRGEVTFEAAQRLAAKEIVAEHKAKPRRPTVTRHAAGASDAITVKNARQVLLSQLRTLAERMRHPMAPSAQPVASDGLNVAFKPPPAVNITKQPEPEPTPAPATAIGVFAGHGSTAELLPDDFPASASWADEPLRNWRRSIETNERITKRDRWIG
jgi:hypothetical protein